MKPPKVPAVLDLMEVTPDEKQVRFAFVTDHPKALVDVVCDVDSGTNFEAVLGDRIDWYPLAGLFMVRGQTVRIARYAEAETHGMAVAG